MSKFDDLKYAQSATAEEKLQIVRHEFLRQIAIVNGYASILKEPIGDAAKTNSIFVECSDWIDKILEASYDMSEILDIMTSNSK
ncbi:MAG: hypothetical protein H0X30_02960 [Anaerolineae bacterium]|nr:hypothetical protein [Anaerolineae bacterium]